MFCSSVIAHLWINANSYDNKVRLYDNRRPLVPIEEADVGGGAWRVKWHPHHTRRNDLLVACMHDGFKVIRFSNSALGATDPSLSTEACIEDQKFGTIKRFDKHESLAYGVDWSHADDRSSNGTVIASCSFYDHSLHVWQG